MAEYLSAVEKAGLRRGLVIDGTDEYGNWSGGFECRNSPPFAVFDIEAQTNLRWGLRSRRAAELALWFEVRRRSAPQT